MAAEKWVVQTKKKMETDLKRRHDSAVNSHNCVDTDDWSHRHCDTTVLGYKKACARVLVGIRQAECEPSWFCWELSG